MGSEMCIRDSYVSVLYTAMLRTSIAAVVLGSFYFSLLDCDASVIVVDGAAVETGCLLEKYIKCYSPSPLLLVTFAFISNAVAAVEKGYAFCFWSRSCYSFFFSQIVFLVGCAAAAAGACAAYNIGTEAEIGTGYCFSLLRFVTAMVRTSDAAVVLGSFYFCDLDCDASVCLLYTSDAADE